MATDAEAAAGAQVIAESHTIDEPKLPAPCWMGLARAVIEAADKVRAEEKRRTCTHPRKTGNGMLSSDGSSSSYWNCPDCGASGHVKTGPRAPSSVPPFGYL